jgi:hypothetical protein
MFKRISLKPLIIVVSMMMLIVMFPWYSTAYTDDSGVIRLEYLVYVDFYVKGNDTLKESFRPLGEVVLVVGVEGNRVSLLLRPESFGEFKYYFSKILEESVVIPGNKNNMTSSVDYKQYMVNQLRNNKTYARQMYSKYLKSVRISNITVSYTLDDNNYVIEYPEVGFFPLYSIKPLYPSTIENEKPFR